MPSASVLPDPWTAFRTEMPIARRWAYFDHAAVSPLPVPTRDAVARWLEQATFDGDTAWPAWSAATERTRQSAAELVGAQTAEIALVPSTTYGISLVAEGFPWQPGDNVVTLANEFPSNAYPWLHLASRGVETRRVAVPGGRVELARLAEACDRRTRIVAVSWVGFASGFRLDLDDVAAVAHARGARLFVDAIQGLGVFPLDVRRTPVDYFAADGHKWLLGPEGAGLFYCRREHLAELRPISVGWNSVEQRHDFDRIELRLRETAARFEPSTQNMAGFLGLGASLDFLRRFGLSPERSLIADRVLEIAGLLRERLRSAGAVVHEIGTPREQSGIVGFEWPGEDPLAARRRCLERGVALSCRGGRLRASPHAYAHGDDIDRLVAVLQRPLDAI